MPRKKAEETEQPKTPSRKKKAAEPEPEAAPAQKPKRTRTQAAAPIPAEEPKPARKPAAKKQAPTPAEPEPKKEPAPRRARAKKEPDATEPTGLAVVSWRSRPSEEKAPAKKSRPRREPAPEPETEALPVPPAEPIRKSRRRRGDKLERPTAELPEPRAAEPPRRRAKAAEPAPQPVGHTTVAIPQDAPQVVDIRGVPTMVVRQRAVPPILFSAAAPDEQRLQTVLDELRFAVSRGIRLVSLTVELFVEDGGVDQAVVEAGYLLRQVASVSEDVHVLFRIAFRAPDGWEQKYRAAAFVTEEGGLADPSVCDGDFWSEAEESLRLFVRKLRKIDRAGQVVGLHLDRSEWFYAESDGYDTSIAAVAAFRQWLRQRYSDDVVSLRAAWFNGSAQFETIAVPEFRELNHENREFVRTDRKARPWVDYHLFLSDAVCDRLARLAYVAKSASDGYYLVGASYGYTFEWSHPASGHLALGKMLRAPEIDYLSAPPSYKNREPGRSASFSCPVDSFPLNGKLFLSEEDFKTSISGVREPDDFNPAFRTPQALESAQWRGAGAALAHGSGVVWSDRWGNGWLGLPGIWQRGEAVQRALAMRLATPLAPPDVAMLVDERSLAYLLDAHAFEVLVQSVCESLLRSGLSVGFYLLSDLAHRESFPDSRIYVFVNAWDIRREVRSSIKGRLQRDGKLLMWLYAAGLFEGGRDSLERVREVTGIALRAQPFHYGLGTTLLNQRDPLSASLPSDKLAASGRLEPSYFAIPEAGRVLGEYTQTGLPSFVLAPFNTDEDKRWTSVFLGEPIATPSFFRALAQEAGAHVWGFQDDVIHVRPPFLCVHCTGAGQRSITLPEKTAAYSLTADSWMQTDGNHMRFQALDGQTHVFLVAQEAEIERLLDLDPEEVLQVGEIAPRQENTVHWNELRFDVPIMKLDEWVEESWGEDLADDFLIKPSMFEPAPSQVESDQEEEFTVSRGGQRRKRRGRRQGGEPARDQEDDTMHVLFRKRE